MCRAQYVRKVVERSGRYGTSTPEGRPELVVVRDDGDGSYTGAVDLNDATFALVDGVGDHDELVASLAVAGVQTSGDLGCPICYGAGRVEQGACRFCDGQGCIICSHQGETWAVCPCSEELEIRE